MRTYSSDVNSWSASASQRYLQTWNIFQYGSSLHLSLCRTIELIPNHMYNATPITQNRLEGPESYPLERNCLIRFVARLSVLFYGSTEYSVSVLVCIQSSYRNERKESRKYCTSALCSQRPAGRNPEVKWWEYPFDVYGFGGTAYIIAQCSIHNYEGSRVEIFLPYLP